MAVAVKMPQMGESVVEGTVARWLKAPGETVDKLEPLLEINTDKIDTEVPAPAAGTLLQVMVDAGQTVRAGTVLAYIGAAGETVADAGEDGDGTSAAKAPVLQGAAPGAAGVVSTQPQAVTQATDEPGKRPVERPSGREYISPVVARIADEHGVDLAQLSGSGLGGRITKKDILAHVAAQEAAPAQEPGAQAGLQAASVSTAPDEDAAWSPLSAMRRTIAAHMVQSKQTSPHVTTVFEVDMTAVVRHRAAQQADFAARGIRLTFTPYFVAAVAHALRLVPAMNSRFHSVQGEPGIVENRRIHVGIAVALEAGLIVPVLRDADELNLAGLARAVNSVAERARTGKLDPSMTRGGTFTITNHGVSGSLLGTPIINQPQTGILGIGAIVKRPVVRSSSSSLLPDADDAIVIRPMCYLSLSFDHRVVDGAQADHFVAAVAERLGRWPQDEASPLDRLPVQVV